MKNIKSSIFSLLFLCVTFISCENKSAPNQEEHLDNQNKREAKINENENEFARVMKKHLAAVSNKNLDSLKATMAPNGQMQLILPASEIIDGVDGFMDYHKEWFAQPNWTFETKILNSEVGRKIGMAVVEIIYREPEREGKPYFNKMIVSYDLKKFNGVWYVIKDQASSVEKSTDVK